MSADVFVPDYRLAPEHPYPAALDDALDAYRVVSALCPSLPIVVTGDSARVTAHAASSPANTAHDLAC